jgi:hypothetical protein
MTLDERGRRAAEDVHAAVATSDFDAMRARVRERSHGEPGRPRRSATLVAAAVLLVVGLGIGVLLADHLHTHRSSTASRTPRRATADALAATTDAQGDAAARGGGVTPQLSRSDGLIAFPTADLVDGEAVHLVGTGFAAGTVVRVSQCSAVHGDPRRPDHMTCSTGGSPGVPVPKDGGPVAATVQVHRVLATPSGTVDCGAARGACVLVMSGVRQASAASAPPAVALTFAPGGATTTVG